MQRCSAGSVGSASSRRKGGKKKKEGGGGFFGQDEEGETCEKSGRKTGRFRARLRETPPPRFHPRNTPFYLNRFDALQRPARREYSAARPGPAIILSPVHAINSVIEVLQRLSPSADSG